MSVKHVKEYYNQVCSDYSELLENLRDMEEELQNNLVSPDRVEQLKRMIEPIKQNYERISYIIFLLDMPNRKEKQDRYKSQQRKKVYEGSDLNSIKAENKNILDNMKF